MIRVGDPTEAFLRGSTQGTDATAGWQVTHLRYGLNQNRETVGKRKDTSRHEL